MTRQEVFFFAPPAGMRASRPRAFPGWADFNNGDIYYGMADIERRGFKIAHDKHGLPVDPDRGDRVATPGALSDVRAYLAKRFPALANAPLNEERVCQYENSSNGDLLIDRHPTAANVLLVGAGSRPRVQARTRSRALCERAADGKLKKVEPRFSLVIEGRAAEPRRSLAETSADP